MKCDRCPTLIGSEGKGPAYAYGREWLCERCLLKEDKEYLLALHHADAELKSFKNKKIKNEAPYIR